MAATLRLTHLAQLAVAVAQRGHSLTVFQVPPQVALAAAVPAALCLEPQTARVVLRVRETLVATVEVAIQMPAYRWLVGAAEQVRQDLAALLGAVVVLAQHHQSLALLQHTQEEAVAENAPHRGLAVPAVLAVVAMAALDQRLLLLDLQILGAAVAAQATADT